jgi:hypothetical protein
MCVGVLWSYLILAKLLLSVFFILASQVSMWYKHTMVLIAFLCSLMLFNGVIFLMYFQTNAFFMES